MVQGTSIKKWFNQFVVHCCSALVVVGCGQGGPVAQLTVRDTAAAQLLSETPWPSDLLRDDAGHVALAQLPLSDVGLTPYVLDDLHQVEDGFGVSTGAYFPVSDAIDAATLDGNVHLYDLGSGAEIPLVTHLRALDRPVANIYARPVNGAVLREGTQYAYVITRGVHGPSGALRPSGDLSTLLSASSAPSGALGRAYAVYKPLLDQLGQGALPKADDVAAATVFTTHSVTKRLVHMRAALAATPPPVASVTMVFARSPRGSQQSLDELLGTPAQNLPGGDNPGGVAHDHIAFVVQGTFQSPDYLNATSMLTPVGGSGTAIGVFDETDQLPRPKGTATVPFTLVVPDVTSYANLPVVIFQHGLGGDRSAVMSVANTLASAGFATLGIDIPFHGGRDSAATDTKHRYGGGTGPDGWGEWTDNPAFAFFDAVGDQKQGFPALLPAAARAAFMQSAFDVMQEVRLVTVGDLGALGTADMRLAGLTLRHDRVGYSGESFGAMYGVIAMAIEPDVGAALFDVGGGGLIFPLLLASADEGPVFAILLDGALGTSTVDPVDPPDTDFGYNLAQYLLEGGDPAAYGPYVLLAPVAGNAPKNVLQLSAHLDETVPNQANEALAGALGLQPFDLSASERPDLSYWPGAPAEGALPTGPNVTGGGGAARVGAFVQFEPGTHGLLTTQIGYRRYDVTQPQPYPKLDPPHTIDNPIVRAQGIYLKFMSDYFTSGTPTVVGTP
jgi:hypothetical protein